MHSDTVFGLGDSHGDCHGVSNRVVRCVLCRVIAIVLFLNVFGPGIPAAQPCFNSLNIVWRQCAETQRCALGAIGAAALLVGATPHGCSGCSD